MAKNDNLTDFLTDVADAIRAKKGTTDKINPQDFADEIASIRSEEPTATVRPDIEWTGHVDVEGLKAIGWDDDDIAYLQKYVNWNEEDDDKHKVSDANKALYGILTEKNITTYKYDIIYLPKIDTSTRTNFSNFFYNWYWLEGIPFIDTSNATNVSGMFRACCSLLAVPPINTSKATNVSRLFNDCRQLTEVPWVDTSKATDTSYMYLNCSSLVSIPRTSLTYLLKKSPIVPTPQYASITFS